MWNIVRWFRILRRVELHACRSIRCDVVYGRDSYGLLFDVFYEACWLARMLEEKFDMKLGRPSLSRKPHFAVLDPLARLVGRYFEFSSDVAKIDESEGLGELDILDQLAYDYLFMPSRLRLVEEFSAELALPR